LSLDTKIPLLHVGNARVCVKCVVDAVRRVGHIFVQSKREWGTTGKTAVRVVQSARRVRYDNLSGPGRSLSCSQIQFNGVDVVEDSIAGTDHHFSIIRWIPNQSSARPEMLPLLVHPGIAVGAEQGIAWIEQAGGSVRKNAALGTLLERIHVEVIHH